MDALLIVATSAAYPMIVIVSAMVLGMRRLTQDAVDTQGRPI